MGIIKICVPLASTENEALSTGIVVCYDFYDQEKYISWPIMGIIKICVPLAPTENEALSTNTVVCYDFYDQERCIMTYHGNHKNLRSISVYRKRGPFNGDCSLL